MDSPAFSQLVGRLTESLGQSMEASRRAPEGTLLETNDGFLYAFIEDPGAVSLATADRLLRETSGGPRRLVLFSASRLPLAVSDRLLAQGATVVEGARFAELVRGLGLGEYLGEEPRPGPSAPPRRLLPSAQVLEELVARARTWQAWGVPALALRFFRQAASLKPEFVPAQIGIAQSLLQLGLVPEGEAAFQAILVVDRNNLDARIGLATAQGVGGDIAGEIASFRALLEEDPDRIAVRAHLVAALAAHHRWSELRGEVDLLLRRVPEDPRLRLLKALALEHSGEGAEASAEKERARRLGLRPEAERQIYHELGLLAPAIPTPPPEAEPAAGTAAVPASAPAPPAQSPPARRAVRPKARSKKAAPRSKPARRAASAVRARRKAQ